MICDPQPINLYHKYRQEKRVPFLLESLGPCTPYGSRTILAANPQRKIYCVDGNLLENGKVIGNALDIFTHLDLKNGAGFFPAWMGFFSYEFGRYLNQPTKSVPSGFPDAVFYYYTDGHLYDGEILAQNSNPDLQGPLPGPALDLEPVADNPNFFSDAFNHVASSILRGDVYQVNLAQRLSFACEKIDFFDLYRRMRISNPSPFMGLIEDDNWSIACGSPERLFRFNNQRISSRPIAGTRPRGATDTQDKELEDELLKSPKERAEHAMLVDLVRNDLARVCEPGSVYVDEAYIVERYSHVMHLVSEISGTSHATLKEIFASLFPAGTITGTPKESAMEKIRDLEPFSRGPYTGSMGYISSCDGADFNILIRSAFRNLNTGHIWAGAGIVAQSNAPSEDEEVASKARSVSNALRNITSPSSPEPPRPGKFFARSYPLKRFSNRVLFIENHDSFSHNIIEAIRKLGCTVDVVDHDHEACLDDYKHIIFGPGPKSPSEAGNLLGWLNEAVQKKCAILGICLGHQALGNHFGAQVIRARRPIHGEAHTLKHQGHALFNEIPQTFNAMRYHSLVLTQVPSCFDVIARSLSEEVMAIAHKEHPWFGVQFHPESFLSEGSEQIFANFFELTT